MKTDLDHLHGVVNETIRGRGCGKTYAACHAVAGAIEVGGLKTVIIMISYHRDAMHIRPMLLQILEEHGITCKQISNNSILCSNGVVVDFVSEHNNAMCGRDNYSIVYMTRQMPEPPVKIRPKPEFLKDKTLKHYSLPRIRIMYE